MVFFLNVAQAPLDPIFGITVAFNADCRPSKVNLGVGIYRTADLKPMLLKVVAEVEVEMAQAAVSRPYLPIDGNPLYIQLMSELIFGETRNQLSGLAGAQTLGATSALRIAGEFLSRLTSNRVIYVPDPTWENHRAVFKASGLDVVAYPYYDRKTSTLAIDPLLATLEKIPEGSPVLFHPSCHNPTGIDPTLSEWARILAVVVRRRLFPLFDCAYQGYGEGVDADVASIRLFAKEGVDMFICYSCSKNFGLYGERVGALYAVCQSQSEAEAVKSQIHLIIRAIYSNPPYHGQKIVEMILSQPQRRIQWLRELEGMQTRLHEMRKGLMMSLQAKIPGRDFSFMGHQKGLFSYIGLQADQVQRLSGEFAIYTPATGRINVAGLNSANLEYVAEAIASVV